MVRWVVLIVTVSAVALLVLAGAAAVWFVLPATGRPSHGLLVDGAPVPSPTPLAAYVDSRAKALLDRPVALQFNGKPVASVTLRDLGVRVDREVTAQRAMRVGRTGSLVERMQQSLMSRRGKVNIPLAWTIDPQPIISRVEALKEEVDHAGVAASFDFANRQVRPHQDGLYLDAYGTIESLYQLMKSGDKVLAVAATSVPPPVTASFLQQLDISQQIGHFESRFGYIGGQRDRAHNIAHAAARLDGVVMMPGQVLSFNHVVGSRTLSNGFRKGWEISEGEMVEGVGGGTCQVASTLHAAAYLGGMDVVERLPHSRPIGYMGIGLDATVVDGLVDLKLRNPFEFPVVLHSVVDKGTITFEILGKGVPVKVKFRGDVIATKDYTRTVREDSSIDVGKVVRKQRGIKGYTIRRVRELTYADGQTRQEVTRDTYPPTAEIYLVPPGTEPERDLPPLPGQESAHEQPSCSEGDADCPERPTIVNAPSARQAAPNPARSIVIER